MTDETRQPLTGDVVLAQIMEMTGANTPTDALHRVIELDDKVKFYEDAPLPLLTVDYQGRITVRKDVTVYGLTQIVGAINNLTIAGS